MIRQSPSNRVATRSTMACLSGKDHGKMGDKKKEKAKGQKREALGCVPYGGGLGPPARHRRLPSAGQSAARCPQRPPGPQLIAGTWTWDSLHFTGQLDSLHSRKQIL